MNSDLGRTEFESCDAQKNEVNACHEETELKERYRIEA